MQAYQEEQFFREVYRRPKFPEGGPLLHMLHTQEDLANTPTLSKPKKNKTAKSGSMDDRLAAYTTTIELPDKPRKRGVSGRRTTRRSSSLRNAGSAAVSGGAGGGPKRGTSGGTGGGESDAAGDADPTTAELEAQQQDFYRQSAEEHREFLLETLKQVKEQLQQPSSLLEATDTTGEMEGEEVN